MLWLWLKLIKKSTTRYDNIYLYVKNPFKSKYHLLINEKEKVGIKKLKYPKVFIDYWQTVDDAHQNLENYNLRKKRRVLIVFDDMITDTEINIK